MRKTHLQTALCALSAILALSLASVAACACNHHGIKTVKAKPSCHAAVIHEVPTPVETPTDNDRFEKDCNCNIRISPASVLSRSESKTIVLQQTAAAAHLTISSNEPALLRDGGNIVHEVEPHLYETLSDPRPPSRAPPRL